MVTAERLENYERFNQSQLLIEDLLLTAPKPRSPGRFLNFTGNGDLTVYNGTAPFEHHGQTYLAARVEPFDNEFDSYTGIFRHQDADNWQLQTDLPVYQLQDPAVKIINGEIILAGVKVFDHPFRPGDKSWQTEIWRGPDFASLSRFAVGPPGMKDIRLVELPAGLIGVFTRPQDPASGNLGKAGFTTINRLEELSPEKLIRAPLIHELFKDGVEWGGVNEAHALEDGLIGLIGHIARRVNDQREYYAISAVFNPVDFSIDKLQIISQRRDFPDCLPKKKDIFNCEFPGGVVLDPINTEFYTGVSDVKGGAIEINYPF
ncbi:MAG TPA: DUF1861 family protein [Candidatus Saccharimonadales bacterium]